MMGLEVKADGRNHTIAICMIRTHDPGLRSRRIYRNPRIRGVDPDLPGLHLLIPIVNIAPNIT